MNDNLNIWAETWNQKYSRHKSLIQVYNNIITILHKRLKSMLISLFSIAQLKFAVNFSQSFSPLKCFHFTFSLLSLSLTFCLFSAFQVFVMLSPRQHHHASLMNWECEGEIASRCEEARWKCFDNRYSGKKLSATWVIWPQHDNDVWMRF